MSITVSVCCRNLIYEVQTQAGLTQQQLADPIESKQSAIARREEAKYEGHSLSMLQKIARALNQGLEVQQGRSPLMKITLSSVVRKLGNECARSLQK